MINCNRRDGSARAVNEVAERLADRGNEVHLFARKAEDLDLGKVRWHKVPGPGWPEVADFLSYHVLVNRTIPDRFFDIIHSIGCNTLRANVITIQNIQPAKKKILDRLGSLEKISPFRRMTRAAYLKVTSDAEFKLYTHRPGRRPPLFLPVSRGVERELRENYDIGPAPVRDCSQCRRSEVFSNRSLKSKGSLGDVKTALERTMWCSSSPAANGCAKVWIWRFARWLWFLIPRRSFSSRAMIRPKKLSKALADESRVTEPCGLWWLSKGCPAGLGELGYFPFSQLV